jgi:hypothetical protein
MEKSIHMDDLDGNCGIDDHRYPMSVLLDQDNPAKFLVFHVYM